MLFEVTYDFGIESMAGILDPIAERVIKRVVAVRPFRTVRRGRDRSRAARLSPTCGRGVDWTR